jgi:hypothetical protein
VGYSKRAKNQETRAKSQEARTKNKKQEPRGKSQEIRKFLKFIKSKKICVNPFNLRYLRAYSNQHLNKSTSKQKTNQQKTNQQINI